MFTSQFSTGQMSTLPDRQGESPKTAVSRACRSYVDAYKTWSCSQSSASTAGRGTRSGSCCCAARGGCASWAGSWATRAGSCGRCASRAPPPPPPPPPPTGNTVTLLSSPLQHDTRPRQTPARQLFCLHSIQHDVLNRYIHTYILTNAFRFIHRVLTCFRINSRDSQRQRLEQVVVEVRLARVLGDDGQ